MIQGKFYHPIKEKEGLLSTKQQWINFFKRPWWCLLPILLVFIFVIGVLILVLVLSLKFLISYFPEMLKRNFGVYESSMFIQIILASFFLSYLITSLFYLFFIGIKNKKTNKWFLSCVGVMTFIFLVGSFGIDAIIGNPALNLKLLDRNNTYHGTINCVGGSGTLLAGEKISCTIKINGATDLQDGEIEKFLTFMYKNESHQLIVLEDDSFISPPEVKYLYFSIHLNKSNTESDLSVGFPFTFITREDFDKNKERLLTYILALFAVVFLSVPPAVIHLRDLYLNKV